MKKIHLFPYGEEQIISGKTGEEIYTILNSVTDSRKFIWFPNAEFTGKVSPFCFTITPARKGYRNSFLPCLTGTISERAEGSVVDIVLQIHIGVRIFMTIWSSGVFLFFLCGVLDVFMGFIDGSEGKILILIPAVMIALSQLMMRLCFYCLARRALERLNELIGEARCEPGVCQKR